MNALRQRWAANLAEVREGTGLTQAAVAEAIGVTQQAIAEWENGRATPTPENQAQLVAFYEIDARELFPLDGVA